MKSIVYLSIVLFLGSCHGSKKTSATATENATSTAGSSVVATTATTTGENTQGDKLKATAFTLEKTACFGRCPIFLLTISGANNTAIYKGQMNVDKVGTYQKKVTNEELKALVAAFEKYKFLEMQDEYNKSQVTDLPSIYVSYTVGGNTKKVRDRYQAPAELKELEKLLDAIGNSEGWTKISDAEN